MAKYGQAKYGAVRYGVWQGAIFDRAEQDVTNRTSKGFCNVVDMQRLEDNCVILANVLGVTIDGRSEWAMEEFPDQSEFTRILGNINTLRGAYYTSSSTPSTPENPMNHYAKWNAAERILYDLYTLYLANASAYIRAGEAFAGEQIGVI